MSQFLILVLGVTVREWLSANEVSTLLLRLYSTAGEEWGH